MFPSLTKVVEYVFSMSPTSAGTEKTFHIQGKVQSKARKIFGDSSANQQSNIIFNSGQLKRIIDGGLATGHEKAIEGHR